MGCNLNCFCLLLFFFFFFFTSAHPFPVRPLRFFSGLTPVPFFISSLFSLLFSFPRCCLLPEIPIGEKKTQVLCLCLTVIAFSFQEKKQKENSIYSCMKLALCVCICISFHFISLDVLVYYLFTYSTFL